MLTERQDPWTLLFSKLYSEAVHEFSRCYRNGGGTPALRGQAMALLLSGRPDDALPLFRKVIGATDPKLRAASDFIDAGICYWYLRQPQEAVTEWRKSLGAPYTDAAGGVVPPAVLLYAGARLSDGKLETEAVRLVRNHWKKHERRVRRGQAKTPRQAHEDLVHPGLYAWPGAMVPFLLGKIESESLDQAAANTTADVLGARQKCQADFVAGVRAFRDGNWSEFRDRMTSSAASPHGELEHEFCLARWEVASGFPTEPFAGSVA
jgi:hypothetical protein